MQGNYKQGNGSNESFVEVSRALIWMVSGDPFKAGVIWLLGCKGAICYRTISVSTELYFDGLAHLLVIHYSTAPNQGLILWAKGSIARNLSSPGRRRYVSIIAPPVFCNCS